MSLFDVTTAVTRLPTGCMSRTMSCGSRSSRASSMRGRAATSTRPRVSEPSRIVASAGTVTCRLRAHSSHTSRAHAGSTMSSASSIALAVCMIPVGSSRTELDPTVGAGPSGSPVRRTSLSRWTTSRILAKGRPSRDRRTRSRRISRRTCVSSSSGAPPPGADRTCRRPIAVSQTRSVTSTYPAALGLPVTTAGVRRPSPGRWSACLPASSM